MGMQTHAVYWKEAEPERTTTYPRRCIRTMDAVARQRKKHEQHRAWVIIEQLILFEVSGICFIFLAFEMDVSCRQRKYFISPYIIHHLHISFLFVAESDTFFYCTVYRLCARTSYQFCISCFFFTFFFLFLEFLSPSVAILVIVVYNSHCDKCIARRRERQALAATLFIFKSLLFCL